MSNNSEWITDDICATENLEKMLKNTAVLRIQKIQFLKNA
jgi:hypothetical protein